MSLQTLVKPRHASGPNGLWATFNNAANLTCSVDGYQLSITKPDVTRLDDMTLDEEKAYWNFTFSQAAKGLASPANRATQPSDIVESAKPCSVAFALNDGTGAWQNVNTVHGHIVWTTSPEKIGDMKEHLRKDRRLFSADPSKDYAPLAETSVDLSRSDFAERIRNARKYLQDKFNGTPISFSLYTDKPTDRDPREGSRLMIEAWTPEHHSIGSLSQFIRYWHGLYESPLTQGGPGIRYAGFNHD